MSKKLIVALDYPQIAQGYGLADALDPSVCALKVGNEMFTRFGADFVRQLTAKGFDIFLDLKFHDIPNTVSRACQACADLGVWMINLHASGGAAMMQAARKVLEPYGAKRPLLIAVTVLTSMISSDLKQIGVGADLESQVRSLALLAQEAGLDGVVCSAHEVPMLKAVCGKTFQTVTPGIRLEGDQLGDQQRIVTPKEAIILGSDYLVVGRPITASPDPMRVVQRILGEIGA